MASGKKPLSFSDAFRHDAASPVLSLCCWVDVPFIVGLCWYPFGANLALACVVGVVLVSDVCKLVAVVGASLPGLSWGYVGVMLEHLGGIF